MQIAPLWRERNAVAGFSRRLTSSETGLAATRPTKRMRNFMSKGVDVFFQLGADGWI
jgi:hypothetical protein